MFLGPDLEIIVRVQRARKRESVYIPVCLHRSGKVAESRTSPQKKEENEVLIFVDTQTLVLYMYVRTQSCGTESAHVETWNSPA